MNTQWMTNLRTAVATVLGLLVINTAAVAQDTETPGNIEDILGRLEQIREELRNDPAVTALHEQTTALRDQLKENRWDAETIAQMDILRAQIQQVQNPELVDQMTQLRTELQALRQAEGPGSGMRRGGPFVDMDGDGVNDGFQRGRAQGLRGGVGFGGRSLGQLARIYNDTDGDGVIDEVLIDNDGDGIGDISFQDHLQATWAELDEDGDGIPDIRRGGPDKQGGKSRGQGGRRGGR